MRLIVIFILVFMCACSAKRPVARSANLAPSYDVTPESIDTRTVVGQSDELSAASLRQLNEAAHKPSFGLIQGFYQLPVSLPGGAVAISQANVFGQSYQSFYLQNSGEHPYAVEPMSAAQAQVLSTSVNHLLDAGIRLSDVNMADAMKIMQAEQRIIEKKDALLPGRSLPSGVDMLVSIQSGMGATGPVFVGRVIRTRDGQLFALQTWPNAGPYSLEPLIRHIVTDSLKRLAGE